MYHATQSFKPRKYVRGALLLHLSPCDIKFPSLMCLQGNAKELIPLLWYPQYWKFPGLIPSYWWLYCFRYLFQTLRSLMSYTINIEFLNEIGGTILCMHKFSSFFMLRFILSCLQYLATQGYHSPPSAQQHNTILTSIKVRHIMKRQTLVEEI